MAFPVSGRPLTSVPSSSKGTPTASPETSTKAETGEDSPFVPNVFDFVTLAGRAQRAIRSRIPPLLLGPQAVDSSLHIGDGASFAVSCRAIPKVEAREYTTQMGGLTIIAKSDAPQQQRESLVYKTARIAFTDLGDPVIQDRRAMDSAMMEIYALGQAPLVEHPNIVDLLGLAWGSNPFEPTHRLPVIVLEHAEHGSLAALQEKEELLPQARLSLCLDVAQGLDILHRCGIIHGDVKAENVLVFSHPEKKYIAKIADFGFSVVGEAAAVAMHLAGTRPWKAPETTGPVQRDQLKFTDVYSYGLFVWRTAVDSMNPFSFLLPAGLKADEFNAEVERIKQADELTRRCSPEHWYISYIKASRRWKAVSQVPLSLEQTTQLLQRCLSYMSSGSADSDEITQIFRYTFQAFSSHSLPTQQIETLLLLRAASDPFYGKVSAVLAQCLGKDPMSRYLGRAIEFLQGKPVTASISSNDEELLLRKSFDRCLLSWQQMRNLEPSVQTFVFQRFLARVQNASKDNRVNPPECFMLASFYINGYGADVNYDEAVRLILHAARWGHDIAKAYGYRICRAIKEEFLADDQMISNIWHMALEGSRMASQDLADVAPGNYSELRTILRDGLAGTGARFFEPGTSLLHGFSYRQWMNTFDDQQALVENLSRLDRIAEYRINKRGDRILHIAASCGKCNAIETLLDTLSALDVNHVNDQGETPLLCACRAGQTEVVHLLLGRGADASIATPSKESPLHWLVSFEDADIEIVGGTLIASGADIRLRTTNSIAYSQFPSGIDVDHQQRGTPLSWAVHHDRPAIVKFLLDHAVSAAICTDTVAPHPTPVQWAAHYHHVECLKFMIEAMREEKLESTYITFLDPATRSADVFSMMLRHGPQYRVKLKETFDYLLKATIGVTFSTGVGEFDYTLLYLALSEAHDAVVEYLLSPEVEAMLSAGAEQHNSQLSGPTDKWSRRYGAFSREHINQPCGVDKRTPILECVRWNRKTMFQLLVEHGADVRASARKPFTKDQMDWSALHIFAYAGHNTDVTLVTDLVAAGVPVEGRLTPDSISETPLLVALENNAFNLASTLLSLGADINALSVGSGLMALEHPNTILGHIVASAAQHSTPRLRYLLSQCEASENLDFTVEPERNISALHRAAWAYRGTYSRSPDSNDGQPIQRSTTTWPSTATSSLHHAVEAANLAALELLLERGARTDIRDALDQTPLQLGETVALHADIKCDGCGVSPLRGIRWHCRSCPDHDVCDSCKKAGADSSEHLFEKIALKETVRQTAAARGVTLQSVALNHSYGNGYGEAECMVRILDLLEAEESSHTEGVGIVEEELRGLRIE
ncbi:hypothetical protein EPUS_05934 [Endocarpon pusillum Z07020]|uniref:Protein kinase domain-containing protein n=1 Tax=Endocarpon pusillum (strain Z07020 / HMAS-L-300199) TaxID=1263415 RepID=U1HKB3_ENDPU|nr:uncharacterized protein EPUS_05934 [Endocarpon pusillum Z07020]ERF69389.1 hypothetical protein EPUS_05934 [Endocarpon pusillum Z07020]